MTWMIYQDNLTFLKNIGDTYVGANVAAIARAIEPFAFGALGLLILIWTVDCLLGVIDSPLRDSMRRIIKITIIFSVGIQLGNYSLYVTNFFMNMPGELAASLTGKPNSANILGTLDVILSQGYTIGKGFWDQGGGIGGDFGMYIIAVIVWVLAVGVTAYSCFLILMSMTLLYIIISIGPLFILSLMFKTTENFFSSWIGQLSNYSILILLVYMTNMFVMVLFSRSATGAAAVTSSAQIDKIFPFIVMGVIALLTLKQLPNPASGLAGGIALSSEGAGRMAAKFVSSAFKTTLRPPARLAGRIINKGARKAWSAARGMRNNSISKR